MEGYLGKSGEEYILYSKDNSVLGISSGTIEGRKLSKQNCQAIENGYDLFELAYDSSKEFLIESTHSPSFTFGYEQGFQKALELLGDKKFSVKDMEKLMFATIEFTEQKEGETYPFLKSFIQSLQQTECDVEVVMECCGNYSAPCKYNCEYGQKPKLDDDGCLILRRI